MPHRQNRRRTGRRQGLNRVEKKQVVAILNKRLELKEKTGAVASTTYNSSTAEASLLSMGTSQGDSSVDERVGDELMIKDIHIKIAVKQVLNSGLHRVYAYQFLEDANPSGLGNLQPNDFWPNIQTSGKRYKVLFDRSFFLDVDAGRSHKLVNVRIPVKMLPIKKIKYATGSASIESGQILVAISTDNANSGDQSVDSNFRMRFYDP